MISEVYNIDCIKFMQQFPDKHFELAIVDPPYGIGEDGAKNHSRVGLAKPKLYQAKNWDKQSPDLEYFKELMRVSKNQIIWGANHFISKMPFDSSCWIVWDKVNGDNDFADCELAWSSFKKAVRKYEFRWAGMLQGDMQNKENRIHPTQKPVKLYRWLLQNYAKEGDKILDTHLGSGSSRIACDMEGFDFYGCELDQDYFEAHQKRWNEYKKQLTLF
jgi:site-specific DNA-methyltransferase (adenine-specific)